MPLYLTAFRDNLRLRAGLSGVQVMSAPVAAENVELEVITFIDVDTDEESATLGNSGREEAYICEGIIQVLEPGEGEDDAVVARDRAAALMAEVENEVRTSPDAGLNGAEQVVRMSAITRKRLRQAIQADYRRVVIEFDLTVTTRI